MAAHFPQSPRVRATVAGGFVTGMLAGLKTREARDVLVAAGLNVDLLTDPNARVPLSEYAALYNRVVELLDDEGFGLFSTKVRRGAFEFLCRSVIGSRTLGEALARMTAFLHIVLPDLALSIGIEESSAKIAITETLPLSDDRNDPRRIFAFEWLLRWVHGLSCWLVGRGVSLDSVDFPYSRPIQAEDYPLIYAERAQFGSASLVARLHKGLLALPVIRDQDAVAAFLEGAPGKIAMLYRRDHEIVRRVRDILSASFPAAPNLEEVAARLHLSLRTVQRRLEDEGSSFRAVKAALRRDLALNRIKSTHRPIADIALELGYAETSAFYRAFVEWTGEAPTSYRKRLRST